MKISKYISEFLGTGFLFCAVVGSGIMAENLTNDNALRLTANTLATGAGLFVLITAFANISGAHFNPFVSLAMFLRKKINGKLLIIYIPAQILGCLLGVMLANVFFEHNILELSTKNRDGFHIFLSEIIATFGLIFIIFATLKDGKITIAASVATYIMAGYWFTSSTSFANPAVAIARTFTDSFTGINYLNTPTYILAEFLGALIAVYLVKKLVK